MQLGRHGDASKRALAAGQRRGCILGFHKTCHPHVAQGITLIGLIAIPEQLVRSARCPSWNEFYRLGAE